MNKIVEWSYTAIIDLESTTDVPLVYKSQIASSFSELLEKEQISLLQEIGMAKGVLMLLGGERHDKNQNDWEIINCECFSNLYFKLNGSYWISMRVNYVRNVGKPLGKLLELQFKNLDYQLCSIRALASWITFRYGYFDSNSKIDLDKLQILCELISSKHLFNELATSSHGRDENPSSGKKLIFETTPRGVFVPSSDINGCETLFYRDALMLESFTGDDLTTLEKIYNYKGQPCFILAKQDAFKNDLWTCCVGNTIAELGSVSREISRDVSRIQNQIGQATGNLIGAPQIEMLHFLLSLKTNSFVKFYSGTGETEKVMDSVLSLHYLLSREFNMFSSEDVIYKTDFSAVLSQSTPTQKSFVLQYLYKQAVEKITKNITIAAKKSAETLVLGIYLSGKNAHVDLNGALHTNFDLLLAQNINL